MAQKENKNELLPLKKYGRGKNPNLFYKHKPSAEKDSYIEWVNKQNLSWKANPCMLS